MSRPNTARLFFDHLHACEAMDAVDPNDEDAVSEATARLNVTAHKLVNARLSTWAKQQVRMS